MTQAVSEGAATRSRIATFFRVARAFWATKGSSAWPLTLLTLFFIAANLSAQLWLNVWNRWFFDALESRQAEAIWAMALLAPFVIAAAAIALTGMIISKLGLQLRWREWMTKRVAGWWLSDQRYYRLSISDRELQNPEYRIADDVKLSVEPLVDLAIGLLSAFVNAAAFVGVLWTVGGSLTFQAFGREVTIPGYMALMAVAYALLATTFAYFSGRPLVKRVAEKNEAEAKLRAEMTRLRENAESIALIRGDADELGTLRNNLSHLMTKWFAILRQNIYTFSVLHLNSTLTPIAPLVFAAPNYLAGTLSLGGVMQLAAAFVTVQMALNWFVDNALRLADWYASVERIDVLIEALEAIDAGTIMEDESGIRVEPGEDEHLHLNNLSVAYQNGRVVVDETNVVIQAGERVLLAGESGTGKSTLVRAIAGLWPWGSGHVRLPKEARIAFVPQKPYIPKGSLRTALLYPANEIKVSNEAVHDALKRCGLSYLASKIDDEYAEWDRTLSGGERQRLAFARLLIQKPSLIIMDEATSALDEDSQTSLLMLFHEELKEATVLSVAHRPDLEMFHDRKLTLKRHQAGARMTSQQLGWPLRRLFGSV